MNFVPAVLLAAEIHSLGRLARGIARKTVPGPHLNKLFGHGLVKVRAGEIVVTTRGHAKLVVELTRVSWADAAA